MVNGNLAPEQITDKNGKKTTVHKRPKDTAKSTARVSKIPPAVSAPDASSLVDLEFSAKLIADGFGMVESDMHKLREDELAVAVTGDNILVGAVTIDQEGLYNYVYIGGEALGRAYVPQDEDDDLELIEYSTRLTKVYQQPSR